MANSFVIVALPCEDDYVNQVSSDKVPHMTLVFMGDSSNVDSDQYEHIVGFVEHAASLINPFYMDVDYRGTLGPDNADVLFFEKGWDFKMVCQFRDNLMSDPEIKKAELSVPNPYAQFTPHLTLGYPTSPAKKPDHEHPFYSVRFDRIAVWLDNFDGPEFRLMRDPLYAGHDSPYVSMSGVEAKTLLQVNVSDILSHHGIKGQKWGVRRTHPSASGGGDRALNPTPSSRLKAQVKKIKDTHDKSLGEPTPVVAKPVVSKKTGKAGIATTGGERQPAHPDAITAAAASAQLHTSGIKSLSNKELQDLATRLNLEQNVNRLDPAKVGLGRKIVQGILNDKQAKSVITDAKKQRDLATNAHDVAKFVTAKKAARAAAKIATAGAV